MDKRERQLVGDIARRVLRQAADRDDQITLADSVLDLLALVAALEKAADKPRA